MKINKIPKLLFCCSLALMGLGTAAALSSCTTDSDAFNPDDYIQKNPETEDPDNSEEPGKDPEPEIPDNPDEDDGDEDFDKQKLYEVTIPGDLPSQIKEYTGFTLSFNKDNKTSNYVVWELLSSETNGSANRNDYDFWQDNSLEGCPTKDYAYSTYGYQRGHMCPAADQKWSEAAMRDCFSMANMCPQYASLNEKMWATLENKEREWARRDGAIWIVCGPVYSDDDTLRIGYSQVRVASAYYKAFLAIDVDEPRAIGFIFPNGSCPGDMKDYSMTIDQLEEVLGYDFFSALPDEIENKIEAEDSYSKWIK
ncbi:MAG: DNA/RNA non-specific endonuclease [Muribaculaceae bacterium]|nr:DNA/RNA non-specific endonuclease [Muribaculaceae bacterium]